MRADLKSRIVTVIRDFVIVGGVVALLLGLWALLESVSAELEAREAACRAKGGVLLVGKGIPEVCVRELK